MLDPEAVRAGAEVARAGAAAYSALAERAARQRSSREARVKHREEVRKDLEANLAPALREGWNRELIVIDAARPDLYPELDGRFRFSGLSPWFKVEAIAINATNLEAGLAVACFKVGRRIARESREGEARLITGTIPLDGIIEINWRGFGPDPYPTFYCHFDQKYGAYESHPLYRIEKGGVDGREAVKGVRLRRRRPIWKLPGAIRLHLEVEREHRRFEREIRAEQEGK
jgi:hypothetical protein